MINYAPSNYSTHIYIPYIYAGLPSFILMSVTILLYINTFKKIMRIESYKFTHNLRVRWSEVDSQKVVFNANYLNYFDIGVTEYYKAIGCPYLGPLKKQIAIYLLKKQLLNIYRL